MSSEVLRRYTELPFVLHMLRTRKLPLLDPSSWDDKNDAHFMQVYRERQGLPGVFAACLTEDSETYHHWKIFSPGSSGVCVKFRRAKLNAWVGKQSGLRLESVRYKTIGQLSTAPPQTKELPFIKRFAFKDEREFRLVLNGTSGQTGRLVEVPFSVNILEGIVINPWIGRKVAESVRDVIRSIPYCKKLKVYQSTLVQNSDWKQAIDGRPVA